MNTILHLKANDFVDPKNVGISLMIWIDVKSRICIMFELPNLHLNVVTVKHTPSNPTVSATEVRSNHFLVSRDTSLGDYTLQLEALQVTFVEM